MARVVSVLIVIACIVLAFTNPGEQVHKRAVYDKLPNELGMNGFLGAIAGSMMGDFDVMPLSYHNYLLFSTMTFEDDILSVGILGYVGTTDWDSKKSDKTAPNKPG